jgi:hypothetical protein
VYLTACVDESGTHEDSSITVVAGIVGYAGQWTKFEKKWARMLKEANLTHFHARDAMHRSGECKGWSEDRRDDLFSQTDRLMSQFAIFQFIASLSTSDYDRIYKVRGIRPKGMDCPDSKYGMCIRYALSVIPMIASEKFGDRNPIVNLVLESGHRNAGDVVRIFHQFKKDETPLHNKILGTLSFAYKKECYGIQAADALAYGGYRLEKRGNMQLANHKIGSMWAGAKAIADAQGRYSKPNFRLRFEDEQLIELKVKLLNTVKPKGNGVSLFAEEMAKRGVPIPP